MRLCLLLLAGLLAAPAVATAIPKLPEVPAVIAGNPAEKVAGQPIEDSVYDPATGCKPSKAQPGTTAMIAWLGRNATGAFWGDYRCERWGKGSASLHAERRAIDWKLDARAPAERRAGARLIRFLLAPDRAGNPQALARRMGVQEIIWDCGYWGAGSPEFHEYGECFDRQGRRRPRVDPTAAHIDHLHIGLSRAGAAGRTSFWSGR